MALTYDTVNQILNDCLVEIANVAPVSNVLSTGNPAYQQLHYQLDTAGRELLKKHSWQEHQKEFTIVTDAGVDDGSYPLPDDWGYPIPGTSWNRTDDIPWYGPLNAQDWAYLEGRGLTSQTIYAAYRIRGGEMLIYPFSPVPDGKTLVTEYIRSHWLSDNAGNTFYSRVNANDDFVLFDPILIKTLVKAKFLEAKGFDSKAARADFNEMMDSITGQEKSAPILNAGGHIRVYPYLDGRLNVPDSNFGSS